MCRWLAYSGAPILLEEVLFKTDHSLIGQSLQALDTANTTNGDGFGIRFFTAQVATRRQKSHPMQVDFHGAHAPLSRSR